MMPGVLLVAVRLEPPEQQACSDGQNQREIDAVLQTEWSQVEGPAGLQPRGRAAANVTGSFGRTSPNPRTALPIAGATHTIGVSPAPADGRSFRSSSTTSTGGTSLNRGTRYSAIVPFRSLPF